MRLYTLLAALAISVAIGAGLFLQWTNRPATGLLLSDLRPLDVHSHGTPGEAGNLLALEIALQPADYQGAERLQQKFRMALKQAQALGLLSSRTLVILPPHVGTGLFAMHEKLEVLQARTLRDATQWTALSNPLSYLTSLSASNRDDRRTQAVLRMKAQQMSEAYQKTFSELAREFRVTLVAGSIILPSPHIAAGALLPGHNHLEEVTAIFTADGELLSPLLRKRTLNRYERRYLQASSEANATRLQTPAGIIRIVLGCPSELGTPRATAAQVILVARHEPPCLPDDHTPPPIALQVAAWSLPWNLGNSPHRPGRESQPGPGQLINFWLQATPSAR